MFARVSIYDIPDDRADEAVASFTEALNTIAASRGLAEAVFLVSREGNRGLAMTVWNRPGDDVREQRRRLASPRGRDPGGRRQHRDGGRVRDRRPGRRQRLNALPRSTRR